MTAADIDLDVITNFRSRREDRARWLRAAGLAGKTFGQWARATLSAEATRIEREVTPGSGGCRCNCGTAER